MTTDNTSENLKELSSLLVENMPAKGSSKYTYRMSSCGYCQKRLSLQRLGVKVEVPVFLETAAKEGNLHEAAVKADLRAEGWTVYDEQREYIVEQPGFRLVGHIDGKAATQAGEVLLLEIKSMSDGQFFKWKRLGFDGFPAYQAQLIVYLTVTECTSCLYVVKNRNSGFVDKKIIGRSVDVPLGSLEAILQKLTHIEELAQQNKCAEAVFDPESSECRQCEYKFQCMPVIEPSLQDSQKLSQAVIDWREGKDYEARAAQLIGSAKKVLEEHTWASKQSKWAFDGLVVRQQNGRTSYDQGMIEGWLTPEQLKQATKVGKSFIVVTDTNKD